MFQASEFAYDYGLAAFDIRNVLHFSGGYELPFGNGKTSWRSDGAASEAVLGGWSVSWSAVLTGRPTDYSGCPSGTGSMVPAATTSSYPARL